jgi:glycosyltransferase involved in cell wall biosynthesis
VLGKKQGVYLAQVPENVKIVDLQASRMIFSVNLVGKYLRKANPDVLISANERVNIIALLAGRLFKANTKIIVTIHTSYSSLAEQKSLSFYRKVILCLARVLYKRADEVVAVSKGVAVDASQVFNLPLDRIKVIYNPLVDENILLKSELPVEHPWLQNSAYKIILGIGRLVDEKDFATLLGSFAEVKKMVNEAKLIILGEGPRRKELEGIIAQLKLLDDVSMPGFVDNPYGYLKRSSLFVLSSKFEGLPTALIEAMATGTPVVATDCKSGPAEILDQGEYGLLVPVGNRKLLCEAILTTLSKPPRPEILIERANDFSVHKAVESYAQLFNNR